MSAIARAKHSARTGELDALRSAPRLPMIGLLGVEMVIGYEWFVSGLVKFIRGGFPAGLAQNFRATSEGVASWYASFLENAVIPNCLPLLWPRLAERS